MNTHTHTHIYMRERDIHKVIVIKGNGQGNTLGKGMNPTILSLAIGK